MLDCCLHAQVLKAFGIGIPRYFPADGEFPAAAPFPDRPLPRPPPASYCPMGRTQIREGWKRRRTQWDELRYACGAYGNKVIRLSKPLRNSRYF